MAFDKTLMSKLNFSLTEGKVGVFWVYGTTADNLATVKASAYFNDWFNQVTKGDFLYIIASDGTDIQSFTNTTGVKPVTVASFITAGDIADGAVTEAKLAPNTMTGTIAANVANLNVIGGFTQIFQIDTPGGATSNTDVIVTHKIRVIDVWVVNNGTGTASDTIQVKNGTGTITDAIDISGADSTVARTSELDDSNFVIDAAGTLRVTQTDGGGSDSPITSVYVLAMRVA